MGFFNRLKKILTLESNVVFLLSLVISVSCVYTKQFFSILMPITAIVLVLSQEKVRYLSLMRNPPMLFIFLLIIMVGMSTIWSLVPIETLKIFASISLTYCFAYILLSVILEAKHELIKEANNSIILIVIFISIMFIFQIYMEFFSQEKIATIINSAFKIKPIGSIIGLCVFPICAFSWINNRKILSICIYIILSMLVYISVCQTAIYSLALCTLVFAVSYILPRFVTLSSMIVSFIYMIFVPFLYIYVFPAVVFVETPLLKKVVNESLFHRILAWEFYSRKFFEMPFLGWGAGAARYIQAENGLAAGYMNVIHPHNGAIQSYLELGMLGGLLFALIFASLFWIIQKHVKDRLSVAVCNSTLVFALIASLVTHNIWHSYWTSRCAMVAGLVILFVKARVEQLRVPADHL